jgi:REP element-mobilizing transposase RayT
LDGRPPFFKSTTAARDSGLSRLIKYQGAFYHVTARGNERKKIYYSKYDYEKFMDYVKEAKDKYDYLLHCYVLMTNHYLCGAPHK